MKAPERADESAAGDDSTRVWGVLAHIVTPTTFIAALMIYFGAMLANTTYRMLGMEPTLLDLSWQDYMMYSIVLAEPLVIMLLVVLAALLAHVPLVRFLTGRRKATVGVVAALIVLGSAGVVTGVSLMAGRLEVAAWLKVANWLRMMDWLHVVNWLEVETWLKEASRWPVAPICLGLGLFVLGYAVSLHARAHPCPRASPTVWIVQRAVFVALLAILLMWSLAGLAQIRAAEFFQTLQQYPSLLHEAVIYAPRRLHLKGPGIVETVLPKENAMFRYRYTGLSLVIHANGKYFLLPACWATTDPVRAISLPADDSLRLEFSQYTTLPDCPPVQ